MSGEPQVSLHAADPQHPAEGVVDGLPDDVLSAQAVEHAPDHARREADRSHGPEEAGVATAAAAPAAVETAQADQVTDDHDYSGASALERDTGQVERDAPPADDGKDGDGSPESLVADAVDPPHDDHADTPASDDHAAAAPADDHSADSAAHADDHGSSYVDDGSASG